MLYAPYLTNENACYKPGTDGLTFSSPDNAILGNGKGPYGYIIIPATEKEKAVIVEEGKSLLSRLAAYKPWFKVEPDGQQAPMHHRH